jgi:hypothetical protein
MEKKEWLKIAIGMVFAAKDDDQFDAWFVKYLLTAIGDEFEHTNEDRVLPSGVSPLKGGSRSPVRNPRLSKSQREAQAQREAQEDPYGPSDEPIT